MKVDLNKKDLINLLSSVSPDSINECCDYEKRGLMTFTGNQWNENWSWSETALSKLTENEIYKLYLKHK